MDFNFGFTATDYARYRAGFPDEFFERVFEEQIVKAGDVLVDLGTGTGTLARGFAARGCHVTGFDISTQMLEQARELSTQAGLNIEFRVAKAEETGLPNSTCNIVSAGQYWHWFDSIQTAQEVKRILKPGGQILIAHFDWLPLTNTLADLTERLIRKYNPSWYERFGNRPGIYPQWLRDLSEAGFIAIKSFSFDMDVPYSAEAWRGRIRASSGVGASLSNEEVSRFDAELKSLLEETGQHTLTRDAAGRPIFQTPHRIFVVHAQKVGQYEN